MAENRFHNENFDEMDMIISQISTEQNEHVDSEGNFAYEMLDDIDEVMSQMGEFNQEQVDSALSTEVSATDRDSNFAYEMLDDIDEVMSQMGEFNHEQIDSAVSTEAAVIGDQIDETNGDEFDEDELYGGEIDGVEIDGDENNRDIPPEILAQYEKAMRRILPKRSVQRYELMYKIFMEWQEKKNMRSFDERVLVAYFSSIAEQYAPTTLWSRYSMLKKTLICKENLDISNYKKLIAFLKENSDGYEPKQSNIFEDIKKFVMEAPNEKYLAMKAILGIGVLGVCRGDELTNLTVKNIKDTGEEFILNIPKTKTTTKKMYVIEGEFTNIIREYIKLRPPNVPTDRFFLQYRDGKCRRQVIGKNWIAKVPKVMAEFLKLPNPNSYTGHSYRRTGTTIAANSGASIEQLKRIGDWKSSAVCEKYIQESVGYKRKLGRFISGAIDLPSSSETENTLGNVDLPDTPEILPKKRSPMSNIDNCASASTSNSTVSAGASNFGSFGINVPDDKKNIVFHFGGECSNFTIFNMK